MHVGETEQNAENGWNKHNIPNDSNDPTKYIAIIQAIIS